MKNLRSLVSELFKKKVLATSAPLTDADLHSTRFSYNLNIFSTKQMPVLDEIWGQHAYINPFVGTDRDSGARAIREQRALANFMANVSADMSASSAQAKALYSPIRALKSVRF